MRLAAGLKMYLAGWFPNELQKQTCRVEALDRNIQTLKEKKDSRESSETRERRRPNKYRKSQPAWFKDPKVSKASENKISWWHFSVLHFSWGRCFGRLRWNSTCDDFRDDFNQPIFHCDNFHDWKRDWKRYDFNRSSRTAISMNHIRLRLSRKLKTLRF